MRRASRADRSELMPISVLVRAISAVISSPSV
jgi:hypothetical protein